MLAWACITLLGEQLGREALPFRDALDFDRHGIESRRDSGIP